MYLRVLSVVCVWCQPRDFDGDFSVPLVFLIESLDVAVFDSECACDSVNGQQCLNYLFIGAVCMSGLYMMS